MLQSIIFCHLLPAQGGDAVIASLNAHRINDEENKQDPLPVETVYTNMRQT